MKSAIGSLGTLALVALAGITANACSSSERPTPGSSTAADGERTGQVGLKLVPVTGITISSVSFVVSKGTTSVSEGILPTPGTDDNFSFGLPVPVGTGYVLSLSGVSDENPNITCTGTSTLFDVLANLTTGFSMTLSCVNNSNGQALTTVDVATEECPRLVVDYVVALPALAALPDGTIKVLAKAHDLDNPAATISYAWSIVDPAVGEFTPATGAITTFNCNGMGHNFELTVTADNGECNTTLGAVVTCANIDSCGNGIVEPKYGESCDFGVFHDHPADPTCPFDCNRVCGDGVVEVGEQCDLFPQNLGICSAQCTIVERICGDGLVTPPEVCDGSVGVPMGATCGADCLLRGPGPSCGDTFVASTEECDSGPLGSPLCSPQCEKVGTQACLDCENAGDCFEFFDNCSVFSGADKALCYDVMQCIQDSNCDDGTGTLGFCFCGTVPAATCSSAPLTGPGAPNGACSNLIVQGLQPLATSAEVLGLLTATGRPAGAAMARIKCQKEANAGACSGVCGFTPGGPAFP